MKTRVLNYKSAWALLTITGLVLFCGACKYQKVVPASYPDQKLYMSNANIAYQGPNANGIYAVNAVAVPNQVYRYTVDLDTKKFNVLLGVIRAGAYLDGDARVDVGIRTDTIATLITAGKLTTDVQVLPTAAYTLANQVTVPDGSTYVQFPLIVDLNFLLSNPNKKYALAISIGSNDRSINPLLKTTILLLDTKFLIPTATFTSAADPTNIKQINFNNTSANGVSYVWDFGDGSDVATTKSPSHVYGAAGNYIVKLITTGATGDEQKATISITVKVL